MSQLDEKKKEATADGDFGEGIFDMGFINDVHAEPNLNNAKKLALKKVDDSKANDGNKRKARAMVQLCKSAKALVFGMTNFSLAHQGHGVIK